jgi:23S rRNA (uracil1939-C5)-methyltransferase
VECRHFPRCPGCAYVGRPYEEQLARKRERLARAFSHFPHLPPVGPVAPALSTEAYRHRVKLPVHVGRDHVAVGLYDPKTKRVLDTPDCPVLEPGLRDALARVATFLRGRRGVHSVDLRRSAATGELALVLACRGGELDGGPRGARKLVRDVPGLVSVAVSVADPDGKRVMGREPHVIAGTKAIEERIGDTRYRLHAGAFFQVDPVNAVQIHDLVRSAVGQAQSVLDLYAGVGAYGLMLAEGRSRVVLVEEVPAAARSARDRAPRNVEVIEGRVEDVRLPGRFDVAILNPARRGSDPRTLALLSKVATRIVYVSCGPETLARDLDCLAALGVRATAVHAVDLFPQTPEVETVVHLTRGPALDERRVRGPWHGRPSGAVGRPTSVLALVIGDVRSARGVERLASVATHTLVRLTGSPERALDSLARRGHGVAGDDSRTRRFFAERAGLVRPFLHVERAGSVTAPLHGDLVLALEALGGSAPRPPR